MSDQLVGTRAGAHVSLYGALRMASAGGDGIDDSVMEAVQARIPRDAVAGSGIEPIDERGDPVDRSTGGVYLGEVPYASADVSVLRAAIGVSPESITSEQAGELAEAIRRVAEETEMESPVEGEEAVRRISVGAAVAAHPAGDRLERAIRDETLPGWLPTVDDPSHSIGGDEAGGRGDDCIPLADLPYDLVSTNMLGEIHDATGLDADQVVDLGHLIDDTPEATDLKVVSPLPPNGVFAGAVRGDVTSLRAVAERSGGDGPLAVDEQLAVDVPRAIERGHGVRFDGETYRDPDGHHQLGDVVAHAVSPDVLVDMVDETELTADDAEAVATAIYDADVGGTQFESISDLRECRRRVEEECRDVVQTL